MKVVVKSARQSARAMSTSKPDLEKTILTKSNIVAKPVFFANSVVFREWLVKNHKTEKELWVGFYKKHTGKPSITWEEVVDQCLCFGWIDGIRKSIDDESYTNRITPRNPKKSNWSKINIAKMKVLTDGGFMTPAGLSAFEKWTAKN